MTRLAPTRRSARPVVFALVALLAPVTAGGAAAERPSNEVGDGVVASYRRALVAVERAVRALGGEGGLGPVSFTLEIEAVAQYQSPSPEPPYLELPVVLAVEAVPAERWARVETTTRFPEVEFRTIRVLGPSGAAEVDPTSGVATPAAFAWEELERDFRRSPQLVVGDAWERRAELRWLGTGTVDGVAVDLVAFPFLARRQLSLAIDAEGRLLRHEFVMDDLRRGDAAVSARFLDYRREGDRWLPRRLQQWEGGAAAVEGTYTRLTVGGEVDAERFAVAGAPAVPPGPAGGAAEPAPAGGTIELAPGVHLVRRLEGEDYNSLLVDLGSHFAVVEAPLGPAAAREIVAAAAALEPAKPIRYVVATHFHDDHSGGVPHLVAATGTAVVTTPGNADFFRTATAAPRTLTEPPIEPDGPAELVLVEGRELVLPGSRELRLLDVGPTDHAREMVVAWLPDAGLIFQGDLIRFPEAGALEPAREGGRRLAAFLAERGIEPERIAGVHGRVGSPAELAEAVALASP